MSLTYRKTCPFCGAEVIKWDKIDIKFSCLTATRFGTLIQSAKCKDHQLTQSQAHIQKLEALVREMGEKMEQYADWFAPPGHGHPFADEIRETLNRPLVRAIMEGK